MVCVCCFRSGDTKLIVIVIVLVLLAIIVVCLYCCGRRCYRWLCGRKRRRERDLINPAIRPLPRRQPGVVRRFFDTPWGEHRRVDELLGSSESIMSEETPASSVR